MVESQSSQFTDMVGKKRARKVTSDLLDLSQLFTGKS